MKNFLLGFLLATIMAGMLFCFQWLQHQREIAEEIERGYNRCKETIHYANECRKERNDLWKEIARLKGKAKRTRQ